MLVKYLVKKLETEIIPAEIYCDAHPDQQVIYYNQKDNKFECDKCSQAIPGHSVVTDRKTIDSDCKRLIKLLERKRAKVDSDYSREVQNIMATKDKIGGIVNNTNK